MSVHRVLQRQLDRAGIEAVPPQWASFLERVDRTYRESEARAAAGDRLLAALSSEMRDRLDDVERRVDERVAAECVRSDLVFETVPTALLMIDRGGRVVSLNPAAERLFGDRHAVVDRTLEEIIVIEGADGTRGPMLTRAGLDDALRHGGLSRRDVRICLPVDGVDGSVLADTTVVPVSDDPDIAALVIVCDNAELARARERLDWQTSHDPMTGLANRALIVDRIEASLVRGRHAMEWPTVLVVDLDRFRSINDRHGHAAGDRALVLAAGRLERCVRGGDTVARIGTDEFAVLCDGPIDRPTTAAVVDRILRSLAEPFDVDGDHMCVTASVGVAHADAMVEDAEGLLREADHARRVAKQRGKNCWVEADADLRAAAMARAELEHHLREAIARHEMGVAYQPVQDAVTGELVGFEALARWVHPVLGDVRPNRFVPVAVDAGLIEDLGDRMLDLACRDVATWNRERKAAGLPPLVVHVNISGPELRSPALLGRLRSALRRHAVLPNWMILEITESMLVDDPDAAIERLRELRAGGIRVAIDDYGTGYSSLAYLRRHPVHMVKIDREFIADIASSKQSQIIVRAMIDLARGLDHQVLAEGVETAAELEVLRSLGCGLVQGYLLGMPMPSEEALLLATSSRTRSRDPEPSASAGRTALRPRP
jgi:diguanylate cyclase (GGDEF)-like protein